MLTMRKGELENSSQVPNDLIGTKFADSGELVLAFQPVFDLLRERAIYFEGLSRIVARNGSQQLARSFVENMRGTAAGTSLDVTVLRLATDELICSPKLKVAINVPVESIVTRKWLDCLDELLSRSSNICGRFIIEIDERSAMTLPGFVADFIAAYQKKGVRFALDNFGRGDISLKQLPNFQFDILKIDEHFVRGVASDVDKQFMARVLAIIAGEFDFLCIAEKVETIAESEALKKAGIVFQQGNLFQGPRYATVLKAEGDPSFAT